MSDDKSWLDQFEYDRLDRLPDGGCFAASTRVLTANGYKRISDIVPGDTVRSFNKWSGSVNFRRVTKLLQHQPRRLIKIELENEEVILTTKSHSFLTTDGWKTVRRLRFGEGLHTIDGVVAIVSVQDTDSWEPVFNLVTEGEHTYMVHGCVVHNFTYFRNLRAWLNQILLDPIRLALIDKGKSQSRSEPFPLNQNLFIGEKQ